MSTTRNIIEGIKNVTSDVSATLNTKANQSTTYTKTEVDNKPTGFKNYIINGNFDVWQRSTSFGAITNSYFADRWIAIQGFTSLSKNAASAPTGAYYSTYLNKNSSGAMVFAQRIEAINIKNMASKTITLSFNTRVVSGSLTNIVVEFSYPNDSDNFGGAKTSISSTTLTPINNSKSSVSVALPANVINGLEVKFTMNIVGDTAVTFNQVQLEEGSVATPFEQRPYGLELSLC